MTSSSWSPVFESRWFIPRIISIIDSGHAATSSTDSAAPKAPGGDDQHRERDPRHADRHLELHRHCLASSLCNDGLS